MLLAMAAPLRAQDDEGGEGRRGPPPMGPIQGAGYHTTYVRLGNQGEGLLRADRTGPGRQLRIHEGLIRLADPLARLPQGVFPKQHAAKRQDEMHVLGSGAPVLVTQATLLEWLPKNLTEPLPGAAGASDRTRIVRLDADWPVIARQPQTAPALNIEPRHPAYVIYT